MKGVCMRIKVVRGVSTEIQRKTITASLLPDSFQVAHGEVDGRHARVGTTGSGHPDGLVDAEGGAKELAFLLWLLTCVLLVWCSGEICLDGQ